MRIEEQKWQPIFGVKSVSKTSSTLEMLLIWFSGRNFIINHSRVRVSVFSLIEGYFLRC